MGPDKKSLELIKKVNQLIFFKINNDLLRIHKKRELNLRFYYLKKKTMYQKSILYHQKVLKYLKERDQVSNCFQSVLKKIKSFRNK